MLAEEAMHVPNASALALLALLLALGPARSAAAPEAARTLPTASARPSPALRATAAPLPGGCRPAPPAQSLDAFALMGHATTDYPESAEGRNFNMAKAAQKLCGSYIAPGGTFSFNERLGEASRAAGYKVGRVFIGERIVPGYGGGVCQVASTIYDAAMRAGLPIVERHQHGLTVPYLAPGEDATISYGALDLRIGNDTGGVVQLVTSARGGRVTAEFFGPREPPDVRWRHLELAHYAFRMIRIPDPGLARGKEVVEAAGQDGYRVHTWLDRSWPDGRQETLDLGIDGYRPSPRVVRYGTGA